MNTNDPAVLRKHIRLRISLFIIGLVLSGLTAFPIEWQLDIAHQWMQGIGWDNALSSWLNHVYAGVKDSYGKYPFIAYGTDWLAFAHLVIAVAFVGPWRDPVRNIWVIEFGMIACVAIFPLAFIAGHIRSIPLYWRLIDCSFGLIGGLLLWHCYRKIKQLEKIILMGLKL